MEGVMSLPKIHQRVKSKEACILVAGGTFSGRQTCVTANAFCIWMLQGITGRNHWMLQGTNAKGRAMAKGSINGKGAHQWQRKSNGKGVHQWQKKSNGKGVHQWQRDPWAGEREKQVGAH
eukprot:1161298-Pelagomonas_calceolata.AAC.5